NVHMDNTCKATPSSDVELYIEFATAIPSLILYGLLFVVYCRRRHISPTTFVVLPSLYSAFLHREFYLKNPNNIVYFISRAILMRVTSFSFLCQIVLDHFGEFEHTFTPVYFIYHYSQHAQSISIIALNINRVLAIYAYNSVTIRYYSTHVLLFSIFFIPLPLTWHLLLSPVKFMPSPPLLTMDYIRVVTYPALSILHLIVDCTATGANAGTAILILARLKTLQNRRKTNERSLIFMSLLLSFGLSLSALVQYLIYSLPRGSDWNYITLNRRWIITNFVSLFPPWSLILLSSSVRAEICSLLRLDQPPILLHSPTARTLRSTNSKALQ
ncbi:hypothetical protein PRIPAC_89314, partial [Pristionchus pacificus]|uniref:Serpentine receptor class gamma n=1 Tax=Pristionchus pacificus TaxID=54126 RepID=A0A2A6CVZ5_PRIPA